MNFWTWGFQNLFLHYNGVLSRIFTSIGTTRTETTGVIWIGFALLFCAVISYLLGSINFALVVSKVFYHDDVRRHGSGNAGATNITRTYGKKAGILTFLGDGLKGVLSMLIACFIFGGLFPDLFTAVYLSAFMCIVGHVFPLYAHFHGGKGFATTAMSIIFLNSIIAALLFVILLILVLGTKYISLGSVVTALFYPIFLSMFDQMHQPIGINVLFSLLIAALVTWAHRENIKRILAGTERRIGDSKSKTSTIQENTDNEDDQT